jgi:cytosine/uracil/thiamine/allantoin permease
MRGIIGITWFAVAAFLSAVAIVVAVVGVTSANAATGASQLRAAGTEAYAPLGLFRC